MTEVPGCEEKKGVPSGLRNNVPVLVIMKISKM